MASPSSLLFEDQFTCSICLEVFTEPVSIPCGHNFCKACISWHWEAKEHRYCPLCNEKCRKGLKLCVNTGLRDAVENYRKLSGAPTTKDVHIKQGEVRDVRIKPGEVKVVHIKPGEVRDVRIKPGEEKVVHIKPGEVLCDRCSGRKLKATKSCLVCAASYCDSHQEPHRRVAALKKHKLTDPVPNLKSMVCQEHNRILEFFCKKDKVCFCAQCTNHDTHDMVLLVEEFEEMTTQLEQKKVEIKVLIEEREKKVQDLNGAMETKRGRNNEAKMNNTQVFATLIQSVHLAMFRLIRELDKKQSVEERQVEALVKELENEVTVLQRRIGELENISNTKAPLQFIRGFIQHSSSPFPPLKNWSEVSISDQLWAREDMRKALRSLEETLIKEMERASGGFEASCDEILWEETVTEERKLLGDPPDLDSLPEGLKLLALRQHYGVDMTFDPSSASDLLLFSKDFKEVQTSHLWWNQNDVPHQFNRYSYVLGKTGLSAGRFYYEVQVRRKTGWDLGVVRESVRGEKKITPKPSNGIWIIRMKNSKFSAMSNVPLSRSMNKPDDIGVFVDYDEGLVSFYDVSDGTLIYSFTKCKFNERILPFFSPGLPEGGINGAPLVLSSTTKKEKKSRKKRSPIFPYMIITLVFLFFFHFFVILWFS